MTDKNAIWAGGFILLAALLVAGVVVALQGLDSFTESRRQYLVRFDVADDVGGLRPGSEVRVGGLKVGSVGSIRFETDPGDGVPPSVFATFSLPERIPLGDGAEVAVQSTITGVSWVNVDNLGDLTKPLASDFPIDGDPNTLTQLLSDFTELTPQLTGTVTDVRTVTLPKVNDTIDSFESLASGTERQIAETVAPIKQAAEDASTLTGQLSADLPPVIDDAKRMAAAGADVAEGLSGVLGKDEAGPRDLGETIANVKDATATVKDRLPGTMDKVDSTLDGAQLAIDKVGPQLDQVGEVLADLKETSGAARSIVADNRSRIDRTIANVRQASESFKLATAEIRRSPWRLLYRPDKSESEQLDLYDAARRFAEGANELSAAAADLRAAEVAGDDARVGKLLTRVESKLAEFNDAEQALYQRLR